VFTDADQPRRADLDGRGALRNDPWARFAGFSSKDASIRYRIWAQFLEPAELLRRIGIYMEEEIRAGRLSKGSFPLLREAVLSGQFERGKAISITGYRERMARVPLAKLIEHPTRLSDCRIHWRNASKV
jgi:hypothetical protein